MILPILVKLLALPIYDETIIFYGIASYPQMYPVGPEGSYYIFVFVQRTNTQSKYDSAEGHFEIAGVHSELSLVSIEDPGLASKDSSQGPNTVSLLEQVVQCVLNLHAERVETQFLPNR